MNDPFVSCPYEKIHRVPQSRLQAHIVKCQQRYPKLSICPYNATHRMHYEELLIHVKECPSKIYVLSADTFSKPKHIGDVRAPVPLKHENLMYEDEEWD